MAPKIIDRMADHHTYVEVFGGSGAVLMQKRRSNVEVYNDLHEDLVVFFRVLRDRPDELHAYLKKMEYSRGLHEEVADRWYRDGLRPTDSVVRASEYMFLLRSSFNCENSRTGFSAQPDMNKAMSMKRAVDNIHVFAERMRGVIIENRDWKVLVERYDTPDTFFYMDPPYLEVKEGYYGEGDGFDHRDFIETLDELEGKWLVSYGELPEQFEKIHCYVYDEDVIWGSGVGGKAGTESMITNYNPRTTDMFNPHLNDPEDW